MDKSIWVGSPNFRIGRGGHKPEFIVIHIMAGTMAGTDAWFNNPNSGVSAHSGVSRMGEVHDYVHSTDRAWHAGVMNTKGATFKDFKYEGGRLVDVNAYTLGLEHEGTADVEIPLTCYLASARKIKYWSQRYGIPIDERHIVSHKSIYPGHGCPGKAIDIPKLIKYAIEAEPLLPA